MPKDVISEHASISEEDGYTPRKRLAMGLGLPGGSYHTGTTAKSIGDVKLPNPMGQVRAAPSHHQRKPTPGRK